MKNLQRRQTHTLTQRLRDISFILHKKGCKLEFPFWSRGNKNFNLKGYVWNFIRLLRKIGILNKIKIKALIFLQLKKKGFREKQRRKWVHHS